MRSGISAETRDRDHGHPLKLDIPMPRQPWGSKVLIFNLHDPLSPLEWGRGWGGVEVGRKVKLRGRKQLRCLDFR